MYPSLCRFVGLLTVLAALTLGSSSARADIINMVNSSSASTTIAGGSGSVSAEYFFDPLPLSITGNGYAEADLFDASGNTEVANSTISLMFDLDGPHTFDLTGSLSAGGEVGIFSADFSLVGPGVNLSFSDVSDPSFMSSGFLPGGSYQLIARASATTTGNGSALGGADYEFAFNVIPVQGAVPEPTSLAVFGGLAAAGLFARRRRTAAA